MTPEHSPFDVVPHPPHSTETLGLGLGAGDAHYRAYVGPPEDYDLVAAMCFGLLTALGLRGRHHLLDLGCGSLRLGRLLIPYLNAGHYYGLEPNAWLIEEGLARELGQDIVPIKTPHFAFSDSCRAFGQTGFFDFAIAQSIFSHCGQDLLTQHLMDTAEALTPSGALLATFVSGPSDNEQSGWIYPGCVTYTSVRMGQIARACGYEFHLLDWLHPRQSWALFAKPGFDRAWLIGRPLTWNTWLQHGPK